MIRVFVTDITELKLMTNTSTKIINSSHIIMIDPIRDNKYNIILSVFLGIAIVLFLHLYFTFESPVTLVLNSDKTEPFINTKCNGNKNLS